MSRREEGRTDGTDKKSPSRVLSAEGIWHRCEVFLSEIRMVFQLKLSYKALHKL